jgi:ACS family hexuronate transporter-like MFS transporter
VSGASPLAATAPRPIKNLRWYIAILLCLSTELNYLDRQTLSVLASTIQKDLGLDRQQYAYVTSSFLATYMVMYAVGGRIVDWLGTRRGLMLFATGWSIANMMHALARTLPQLMFFRGLLGVTEAANIPAGVKAVSEWFPLKERALAVGIFNAGTAIGGALAVPIVSSITLLLGWRAAFVVTGALGLVWVAAWAAFYQAPGRHPRLGPAERALIFPQNPQRVPHLPRSSAPDPGSPRPSAGVGWGTSGGSARVDFATAAGPPGAELAATKVPLRRLLAMRETWGCILARVLTDPISYFLNFWVPLYLQDERGFTLGDLGRYGWIPFMALALGNLAAGAIPRALIARGFTLDRARKRTMLGVSLAMPLLCLAVTQVRDPGVALAMVALVMFGHAAWGNIILPAELFPTHVVATVSGLGGALGAAAGALTQLGVGKVVQAFSFKPVFAACSGMYLLGIVLVSILCRDLGRIRKVD